MKTICIYHSRDLDGWMSAAIIKKWFKKQSTTVPIIINYGDKINTFSPDMLTMYGYDYGDKVPEDNILTKYDTIIMVDVSFSGLEMVNIHEQFKMLNKKFIYIDHHKSAINDIKSKSRNGDVPMDGISNTSYAACELTWSYFYPNDKMPEIVRLLGMYDSFRHKGTNEEQKVLEFQYGARQIISNYEDAYIWLLKTTNNIISRMSLQIIWGIGKNIYKYLCTEAKQIYSKAFKINFSVNVKNGYINGKYAYKPVKFLVVNQERFNPINFGIDYHKDGYDGFACFWFKNGKWTWSLYNDNGNIDCSLIAKQYGGGGHKGAAGFVQTHNEFTKLLNL